MSNLIVYFQILVSSLCSFETNSDTNLVGVWQGDTNIISAGLHDTYHLYNDGSFELYFDQYNYLKCVISIRGKYKIEKNQICFQVNSRVQMDSCKIVQGSPGFQDDWILDGKKRVIKQTSKDWNCFTLKKYLTLKDKYIVINNSKYYKISDNPLNYK